jgi:hypothetical protein
VGHKDVGLIRVEIWTINMAGTKPYSNIAAPVETKIHERSKKGGSHQIKPVIRFKTVLTLTTTSRFGQEVIHATRSAAIIEYLENSPLVTFTFKYRSIGWLTW